MLSLSESEEFSSPPNERESSEKAPELDALESLRGIRVDGDDDDDDFELTTEGGTSVDAEATMMLLLLEVETARGLGAVVVPLVFEVDEDDGDVGSE